MLARKARTENSLATCSSTCLGKCSPLIICMISCDIYLHILCVYFSSLTITSADRWCTTIQSYLDRGICLFGVYPQYGSLCSLKELLRKILYLPSYSCKLLDVVLASALSYNPLHTPDPFSNLDHLTPSTPKVFFISNSQ